MHFNAIFLIVLCGAAHSKLLYLSCKRIRAFVDGHNSRRLLLAKGKVPGQPAASEMKFMVWDYELTAKAAKWASRNDFHHNPDKSIGTARFKTGENLYLYATTDKKHKLNIDGSLEYWFEEHKFFNFGPLTRSQFNESAEYPIGHYTQMAWADTVYIGCAVSKYWQNNMKHFLVVCNYGPAGNYLDLTPYKTDLGPSHRLLCVFNKDVCYNPYGYRCRRKSNKIN